MKIEIPEFTDWKEEAEFWDHTDTVGLMEEEDGEWIGPGRIKPALGDEGAELFGASVPLLPRCLKMRCARPEGDVPPSGLPPRACPERSRRAQDSRDSESRGIRDQR